LISEAISGQPQFICRGSVREMPAAVGVQKDEPSGAAYVKRPSDRGTHADSTNSAGAFRTDVGLGRMRLVQLNITNCLLTKEALLGRTTSGGV
jgi:hypothetical protein